MNKNQTRPSSRPGPPVLTRRMLGLLLMLALAGAAGLGPTVLAAPAAPDFVAYARGRTLEPGLLRAAPGSGEALARVAPETELVIGGSVPYRAGLAPALAMWVLTPTEDGPERYGFLPAEALRVTSGDPRPLDLRGIHHRALLSPSDGVGAVGSAARLEDAAGRLETQLGLGLRATRPGSQGDAAGVVTLSETPQDLRIGWLPESVTRWSHLIRASAERHAVDPQLVAIVLLVESGGDPDARSSAGALGLMQVMPSTASGIAAARGIDWPGAAALLQPEIAIDFGAWYLSRQLASFGSGQDPDWQRSVELAAAAYNGGPGTVARHLSGSALPNETARYRQWVGGMWRERGQQDSPTYRAWWDAGGYRLVQAAMVTR